MTPRQSQCLGFIKKYIGTHGYSPTVKEISKAMGLVSRTGSAQYLERLEFGGFIKRSNEGARNITICNPAEQSADIVNLKKAASELIASKITSDGSSVVVQNKAFTNLERALS